VRVCACLCVRMRVQACWAHTKTNTERFRRTQKPTQKGSRAHTKLSGSITPRKEWAAASHFEKIGRQPHAKKNWATIINYKHSPKQSCHSENFAAGLHPQKSVRVWACLCVRVRVRAYWAHTKTNTARPRRTQNSRPRNHA